MKNRQGKFIFQQLVLTLIIRRRRPSTRFFRSFQWHYSDSFVGLQIFISSSSDFSCSSAKALSYFSHHIRHRPHQRLWFYIQSKHLTLPKKLFAGNCDIGVAYLRGIDGSGEIKTVFGFDNLQIGSLFQARHRADDEVNHRPTQVRSTVISTSMRAVEIHGIGILKISEHRMDTVCHRY